jgi:hypothetical protein
MAGRDLGAFTRLLTSAIRRKDLFCSTHPGRLAIYSGWNRGKKQIAVRKVTCDPMGATYSVVKLVNYPVAWLPMTSAFSLEWVEWPGGDVLGRALFCARGISQSGFGLVTCCHVIGCYLRDGSISPRYGHDLHFYCQDET